MVGWSVGCPVGLFVGAPVGFLVVGAAVGCPVGLFEGAEVSCDICIAMRPANPIEFHDESRWKAFTLWPLQR